MLVAAMAAVLALTLSLTRSPSPTPPPPVPETHAGAQRVLGKLLPAAEVAPGVSHREFTTTSAAGEVNGDIVEVDLADPAVHVDLMTAGAVAARSGVYGRRYASLGRDRC